MNVPRIGIALGLVIALLVSGAAFPPTVKAGDVENAWFKELPEPYSGAWGEIWFNDVCWRPDGREALFVGWNWASGNGCAYRYNPEIFDASAWADVSCVGMNNINVTSTAWDELRNDRYVMVCIDAMSTGSWYYLRDIDAVAQTGIDLDLSGMWLYDVEMIEGSNNIVAVGENPGVGEAVSYTYDCAALDWSPLVNGDAHAGANCVWYGVEVNASLPQFYFAGSWNNGGLRSGLFECWNGGASTILIDDSYQGEFTDISYDHNNGKMLITGANRRALSTTAIYQASWGGSFFDNLQPVGAVRPEVSLNGIAVDPSGQAIAVGQNASSGDAAVYSLWRSGGNAYIALQSNASIPFTNHNLSAVAIRPQGIQMALVAGSAFKYSFTNANSNVVVNTLYPHINFVDMYYRNDYMTSVLNGMNNVNPGDGSNWYRLNVSGYFPSAGGGAQGIDFVEVFMWFDNGSTGADGSGAVDGGPQNLGLHLNWTPAFGFNIVYPTSGEAILLAGDCTESMEAGGLPNFNLSFAFSPNQQFRNASGDGAWSAGLNPGGAPNRYWGGLTPDGVEDQDSVAALDDAFSWDIKVEVTNTTSSSAASAYDEFGVNRYVYLGTGAALPGSGTIAGSGAPGANVTLQPSTFQNVTFSANCIYDLKVWAVTDLLASIPANGVIPALNLSVGGGQWLALQALNGTGEANSVWLIGGSSTLAYGNPGPTGVTNNTYNAPGTGNSVVWTCSIPLGKAEDSYSGTLTYAIAPEA
ncbi:MAG: hypothetical protein HZB92_00565 [Euryarchaeota archaeon]|nr:hypothetical protein [Euryarchaeota archaeon]